ncbi:Myb-like DNA-binding domain containing protein [Trichomonas vaginalis G3]|uniref:Myb-like DNA-binding domain containing protein n=1 Tax=Trichomonas vaginalis (strain ATCC PRA-98 / G3) TaxID=412133 RepID=A2G6C8_TRIV3|nr:RNA polymerase II transcription regulator recruiting protein [Trichomonas vaginalis G3]EAX87288.1 Myb-like DNA-binding domain containing protein [Trichomonas vaginalis G3]KAI5534534.1 RNA polymerase II transcription regulator recruiting protein [Trichomonas vaginalis G3]|eukprot:XP_001300218.1 Myb-like DNA-binding domain containing protein [Trichomonas vaginalis G3]
MYDKDTSPPAKGVKRRRLFSPKDDNKLKELLSDSKFIGWKNVALSMPGFTPKQLRDRWHNYLSPKNSFEPWTDEEDKIIVEKVLEFGTKWSYISSFLKGRPDNSIKNRWNSVLKNDYMEHPQKYSRIIAPGQIAQPEVSSDFAMNGSISPGHQVTQSVKLDERFIEHFFDTIPKN